MKASKANGTADIFSVATVGMTSYTKYSPVFIPWQSPSSLDRLNIRAMGAFYNAYSAHLFNDISHFFIQKTTTSGASPLRSSRVGHINHRLV